VYGGRASPLGYHAGLGGLGTGVDPLTSKPNLIVV
jgi:hypothetical protein